MIVEYGSIIKTFICYDCCIEFETVGVISCLILITKCPAVDETC